MRCTDFHRRLADWTRGSLTGEGAEEMSRHAASCRACAEEAEVERSLRASFSSVAPITRSPDLWERIEARVEETRQPRFGFVWRFQRPFALGGALAAGLVMALMIKSGPHTTVEMSGPKLVQTTPSSEPGVLEKIREIRMTDVEPAGYYSERPHNAEAAHLLLVGGPGR